MQALEYPFDGEALLRKKRALRRELAAQPGLVEKRVAIVSGTTVGEVKKHAGAVFVEQRHPPRLLGRAIRPVL